MTAARGRRYSGGCHCISQPPIDNEPLTRDISLAGQGPQPRSGDPSYQVNKTFVNDGGFLPGVSVHRGTRRSAPGDLLSTGWRTDREILGADCAPSRAGFAVARNFLLNHRVFY